MVELKTPPGPETSASNSLLPSASVTHRGLETCGSLCLDPVITRRDFNGLAMSNQASTSPPWPSPSRLRLRRAQRGPQTDMVATQVPLPGSRISRRSTESPPRVKRRSCTPALSSARTRPCPRAPTSATSRTPAPPTPGWTSTRATSPTSSLGLAPSPRSPSAGAWARPATLPCRLPRQGPCPPHRSAHPNTSWSN